MSQLAARMYRAFAFARHVPLSRMHRRIVLEGKRRVLERTGTPPFPGATRSLRVAPTPPLPVFAPHGGQCVRLADGWRFSFLHVARETAGTIDWQGGAAGPEHQLWRMNLHYMHYLEEATDADFAALVAQWIDANPPYSRGYWRDSWNSYALSLRVVVWMQQLAARWPRLPGSLRDTAVASLGEQLAFLEHNLETDIGGNHLVKNIKALAWAGAFFSGDEAARLQTLALQLLDTELSAQILDDGVHYERSPSYHAQVLADLIEIRHALGRDPLSGRLDAAIISMTQAVADLAHPDGGPALLNDAGLTMCTSPRACMTAVDQLLGWRPDARSVFAYRQAGYFGLASDGAYLVADCGPIAPDDLPAHGHGDVLSFELSAGGMRMIVDQGVYQYWQGTRRLASRSAANHNTLCIDGADQADFYGSFRCGRRPEVTLRHYEASDTGFVLEGSHDGFAHLPGAPIHVRHIAASPSLIDIEDRLDGRGAHAASIGILLHPECAVTIADGAALVTRGKAQLRISSSRDLCLKDAVWWPDIGEEIATRRLVSRLAPGERSARTRIEVLAR